MVWIGSSTHSCSKVTVVDANYPQNILDCFIVCTSHLLCITPVPGASEGDYQGSEWSLEGKIHVGYIQGCHWSGNGQGKVRKFYSESGKIEILKKSRGN